KVSQLFGLLVLGPEVQTFWPHFINQVEYLDGGPDPLDRWSVRIISGWAKTLKATAVYPFTGPPYLPFYSWALRSGSCHRSPLQMLVHHRDGLLLSLRGALAVTDNLDQPTLLATPCDSCLTKPCLQSCPVSAFDSNHYDVDMCRTHIRTSDNTHCLTTGCTARQACPISQHIKRSDAQSAFHMMAFLQ
ncbi:ferredoxin, partial [Paracoccaceae bacterium]|nr:ferredoxin [Paracoccaceae bacterium]